MAKGKPCVNSGRAIHNPYFTDRVSCPECGKKDVRVVSYRPKLGGRYADHVNERAKV